jgi:hypothetical protein
VYIVNGARTVNLGQEHGVQILTWDFYNSRYYSSRGYSGSSGSMNPFGSLKPGPTPIQPQPPGRSPPPYSQPGQNPYGVNPPSIGAPWPGTAKPEPEPEAEEEPEVEVPPVVVPEDDEVVEEDEQGGILSSISSYMNNLFGGILLTSGVGILILMWKKFLKKKVIVRVDVIQDHIEAYIEEKYPGYGSVTRDLMEDVETELFGRAEDFVEGLKANEEVSRSVVKGKTAKLLANGSGLPRKVTRQDILAAVKEAGNDETQKKVDEILNTVADSKKKP